MSTALGLLRKHFKFEAFIGAQQRIIETVLADKNCLAILPTGGGKSICYQIPGLLRPGVCLVISPLISLMEDQVANLKTKGLKAITINSNLNQEELIRAFDNLKHGDFKFLYLSPEKLQSPFIQDKIKELTINLVAVDEAHCISEWGHDFRPAYLKIPIIKELHPHVPLLALTATATKRVKSDIIKNLQISKEEIVSQSLVRKNLIFKNLKQEAIHQGLLKLLQSFNKPAIIYANSRKKVKDISDFLNKNQLKSCFYHGGLDISIKQSAFKNWSSEKTPIMVATTAFGMGIDKNNVGLIIHIDLPYSLENYLQEAGRAGRDGNRAYSYVFVNGNSINTLKKQTEKNLVSVQDLKLIYKHLNHYYHISNGELVQEPFDFIISDFCLQYQLNLNLTYNAIKLLERELVLQTNTDFNKSSTLKFTAAPTEILKVNEPFKSSLIKLILRTHGGILEHHTKIDEYNLSKKLSGSVQAVKSSLKELERDGLVIYKDHNKASQLYFLVPREDDRTINRIASEIKHYNQMKNEKMQAVLDYVKNKDLCRSKCLLLYFDEMHLEDCGLCDVCLSKQKKTGTIDYNLLSDHILNLFDKKDQLFINEVIEGIDQDPSCIIDTLHLMLETDKIKLTSQNKLEKVTDE